MSALAIGATRPVIAHPVVLVNPPSNQRLSPQDQSFLEDLERRSFQYFWEQTNPQTGQVLDRTRTDGSPADENHRRMDFVRR